MSYRNHMIFCDVCSAVDFPPESPYSDGRDLEGWRRVLPYSDAGAPEHACSEACAEKAQPEVEKFWAELGE